MSAVIGRLDWGAKYGRGNVTSGAKTRFVIHHDGHDRAKADSTPAQERAVMLMFEDYHVNGDGSGLGMTRKNPRIGYSFVIFPSGRIYEGCGWNRIGAHTGGYNSSAYGVQYPINGRVTKPTTEQLAATFWLRTEGVSLGVLSPHHTVGGHRDYGDTDCPGDLVYDAAVKGVSQVHVPSVEESVAAMPSLRRGKGGPGAPADIVSAVLVAQRALVSANQMTEAELATGPGMFGPVTDRATRSFQWTKGLLVDGIIGPKTWRALLG
jgi:N-acetylmuramoyl-L-alanine amidase